MPPRIYAELADWYTLLTAPADYEEEAQWYVERLREHAERPLKTVLELGCGSGANASHMKRWFSMELVDLSPEMLTVCERINPELPRHQGDMRSFRCGRRFDAVFVHDAASYLLTEEDLRRTAQTVAEHLLPGGVALLCPDDTRENFEPGTDDGGHDAPDGRGLRYLAWDVAGPGDTIITDYAYMIRDRDGTVRVEGDRHVTGRLPQASWLAALDGVGLRAKVIELQHSEVEAGSHHVFVGVRPA